jgi:hypothetical protein
MISEELIADRLRCMLEQIQRGRTKQLLLHSMTIASTLDLRCRHAQTVRNLVYEAQASFSRPHLIFAEQRIQEAIDCWETHRELVRVGRSRPRTWAAMA